MIDRRVGGGGVFGGFGRDERFARRDDPCFDFGFEIVIIGDEHGRSFDDVGGFAEEQDGGADTDFVSGFESDAVDDGDIVDECAVL